MADRTLQTILGTASGLGSATPQPLGVASPGVSAAGARDDHVHALPTPAAIGASAVGHGHVISDVTGLQTALDAKQALDAQLTSLAALVFAGNELKSIRVNAAGDGFELVTSGGGTPDFILQSYGVL